MLVVDPKKRITTHEILSHKWLRGAVSSVELGGALSQMRTFQASRKQIVKRGELKKVGHFVRSHKLRTFVLTSDSLEYYEPSPLADHVPAMTGGGGGVPPPPGTPSASSGGGEGATTSSSSWWSALGFGASSGSATPSTPSAAADASAAPPARSRALSMALLPPGEKFARAHPHPQLV